MMFKSNREEKVMMLKSNYLISANGVINLRNKPYDDALNVINQAIVSNVYSSEWRFTSNSFREKIDLLYPYFINTLKEAGYSVKVADSNFGKMLILSIPS